MTLATVALNCAKKLGRVNAAGTAITDLEDEIKAEIGEAIRFYNRQKWALTEFRGFEITTSAGTNWYSTMDLTSGGGDQDNTSRTAVDVNTLLDVHYVKVEDSNGGCWRACPRRYIQTYIRFTQGSSGCSRHRTLHIRFTAAGT